MNTMPDRPQELASRLPSPARDEQVDPVDLAPQTAVQRRKRRREATVQMGVRVSEEVADRVADYAMREGLSQREVIEALVRNHLPRA